MKVFGRRDIPEEALRLVPRVANDPVPSAAPGPPVMTTAALRERVLKQIDIAAATSLAPGTLQREIEQVIHEIANEERVGLSAREQTRLAEELASDMTGYGPLEALLRDDE